MRVVNSHLVAASLDVPKGLGTRTDKVRDCPGDAVVGKPAD
jgi:hypothetical protein